MIRLRDAWRALWGRPVATWIGCQMTWHYGVIRLDCPSIVNVFNFESGTATKATKAPKPINNATSIRVGPQSALDQVKQTGNFIDYGLKESQRGLIK